MKFKKTAAGLTALALSVTALATPLSENFSGILDGLFDKISYSAEAFTCGDFDYNILEDGTASISDYSGTDTEIVVPSEVDGLVVTSIGSSAFWNCPDLVSVTIPESVTSIDDDAFRNCSGLESIVIPNSVTSIGEYVFQNCSSLESLTIPESVENIGQKSFDGTAVLDNQTADVKYVDNWLVYCDEEVTSVTVKNGTRGIGGHAFEYCYSLTEVILPDSMKCLSDGAFYCCSSLESIDVPNSVTYIGDYAFDGCCLLKSFTIPDGVTRIGNSTFATCGFESITIPDGVTSIGDSAFGACRQLAEVFIPDSVTYIGNYAFNGTPLVKNQTADVIYVDKWLIDCNDDITSVSINSNTRGIAEYAFFNCANLTEITIPDSVKGISDYAFYNCSSLETITLPKDLKAISYWTFASCSSLKSITIPNGVTRIEKGAFRFTGLESIVIPDSVTTIDSYAFEGCSILTEITIPENVTNIGRTAFIGCSVRIKCYPDSVAHKYALENNIPFEFIHVHSYTTKVVAPTYAAKGYTLHECSCGDSYKDTYTAKLILPNVTGLKMTSNATNSISMSWTKVPDATGYVVYQAIDGKWQRIKVTSGNTFTVSNLKAGTNYKFTVKAYKTVSGTNYYCAGYTGVWMTTLPAKPSAKMTVNTPQAIRLEWGKVTGATGYVVYKMEGGKWVKKAVTSGNVYVFTNLASGTNYNFAVRAYRTFNGKNYYSPFATATDTIKTCTKPATVNFTLTAGTKKATVNWSKVTGATGYIVYYKTSANGSWQKLTTTTGTTFTKTGLTTGKTYYFTVKAYKTYNGVTYNASFTTKSVKVK